MEKWLIKSADVLDRWVQQIGAFLSWTSLALIAAIVIQVVLRYVFRAGLVQLEELQWHLYGVLIMVGLSYAQTMDSHVRVDLFHHKYSPRTQAVVEILGTLILLFPFIYVVMYHSMDFIADSFIRMERSVAPEGLPYRWVVKSLMPFGFFLLLLTAFSRLLRDIIRVVKPNGY